MTETKTYCDHCGKELNAMHDYFDLQVEALHYFSADLCSDCLEKLEDLMKNFCKKGGAE